MKSMLTRAAALAIAVLATASVAVADQGQEIAQKEAAAWDGYGSETATVEMILIDAKGNEITRKLAYAAAETEGDGDRSRVEFEWPADTRGTRLLTYTHKTRSDDQWLYLPALGRVKRISSSNQSGAFMGSEFAYEDLASQEIEKYTYKFQKEDQVNGRSVWVYERVPVATTSGYSRQVVYTDKEYLQPVQIEYFDRKGELLKTATFSGFSKLGNWWRVSEIHMVNHQTGKASKLRFSERKLVSVDPTYFDSTELDD